MSLSRAEFRKSSFEGRHFLYPTPVIKEKKYLIEIPEKHLGFYTLAFKKNYLELPDTFPSYLEKVSLHKDGATQIFSVSIGLLEFSLLENSEIDPVKSATINSLLNKKIKGILSEKMNFSDLEKTFNNQKNCSTCQSLGILSPDLINLIESLRDVNE